MQVSESHTLKAPLSTIRQQDKTARGPQAAKAKRLS